MHNLLYTGEEFIFSCEPVRDVSDNSCVVLQIVYKMIHIKDIFKFAAEKINVVNNLNTNGKHHIFSIDAQSDYVMLQLREL